MLPARRAVEAIPAPVKEGLRMLAARVRLASDRESMRRFAELRSRGASAGGPAVELRVRPLAGAGVRVRPGTSDADTLWDAFVRRYHVPPREVDRRGARLVWDLGANIGLTAAHLAATFPDARVVGVELDGANAALARANCAPFSSRCHILEGAVWPTDGDVEYHGWSTNTSSFRVAAGQADSTATVRGARALSLDTLLEQGGEEVAYVKMDIEGAEARVLTEHTGWAESVRAIKVEVHPPYSPDDCTRDLRALGFRVRPDRRHSASVVGVRPRSATVPAVEAPREERGPAAGLGAAGAHGPGAVPSPATVASAAVAGSVGTAGSAAVVGSAGVAGSVGVVGSAGSAASAGVVGSAAVLLSAAIVGSAGIVAGVANVGCAACVACVGCVDCVGCFGCVGCVGLRGAVGAVGRRV